ncbi:MAG TPA: glycosyltransferase [Stellaceae bacterium]|jgi:chlorobactene glucosyltransferase|nr:glycosyltransferase [Stellaceae bacterium]
MWLIAAAIVYAAIVAVALCRAVRQMNRYESFAPDRPSPAGAQASVAVVVPARNEGAGIGPCLTGLIEQDYPRERLVLFAVDDGSTDRTADIIRRIAGRDERVRLIEVTDLPSGWTGKTHACWRGAIAAKAANPEWLCFIDADTRSEPELIGSAIDFARRRGLDMLSLEPFQELTGLLDRLVIPVGFLAIAATQDLRRVNRAGDREVTANGQFILIKAACYFALGGHSAVRGEICEDSAIARLVKSAGYSFAVIGAERLIRTRMYTGAADLWEGLSKNVSEIYGGSVRTLAIVTTGFLLGWASLLLPILGTIAAVNQPSSLAIAAPILATLTSIAVYATQFALARHFRIPFWYGLLFPLACSAGAMIGINAVIWRGRGRVAWKGRFYTAPETAAGRTRP